MRRFGLVWVAVAAFAAAALADEPKSSQEPAPQEKHPPEKPAGSGDAKSGAKEPQAGTPAPKPPAVSRAAADPKAAPAKPAPAGDDAPPAPQSLDAALLRLGRVRVDVDFRDAGFDDAVDFLARVARMNVILSPAYQAKAAGGLPRIDLKLTRVTLRQFAEILAKQTGTRLVVRDGILQFTTPEDARGKPVLRIHPLADLTMKIRNFPGPDINLHLASVEFEDEKESDVEGAFDDPEEIVETVKKMTGEGTWDDEDVSISADQNKLVVKQYPEVQKEIARLLALLRSAK